MAGGGAVTYGGEGTRPDNAPSGPTQNSVELPGEGGPVLIRISWSSFEVIYPCLLLSPPSPVSFLVGVPSTSGKLGSRPPSNSRRSVTQGGHPSDICGGGRGSVLPIGILWQGVVD